MNADGKVDLIYDFAKHMLQSTILAENSDDDAVTPIMDGSTILGLEFSGSPENVSDHLDGYYGKFDLTMLGTFGLVQGRTEFQEPDDADGVISSISITHTPTGASEGVVIATNDGLAITWSELMDNMGGADHDDGPKAVDGYYPLYHDKQDAIAASSIGEAHQHTAKDSHGELTLWMPSGGTEGSEYYHGSYTDMSKDDPTLDIVTSGSTNTPADPVNGDVFNVSGNEWVLVEESNNKFTLIPVKDDNGGLLYDSNLSLIHI